MLGPNLPPQQEYTDSMPIHPLFMDEEDFKNPEMVENNPALDAINKLIDSASPKARAEQCKLDGNQFFEVAQKEKKVRAKREDNMDLALKAYKRGSKFCNDAIKALGHQGSAELVELLSLSSTLHTNSAVVHMARGNLQTAVSECKVAIKIYAGNIKVSTFSCCSVSFSTSAGHALESNSVTAAHQCRSLIARRTGEQPKLVWRWESWMMQWLSVHRRCSGPRIWK